MGTIGMIKQNIICILFPAWCQANYKFSIIRVNFSSFLPQSHFYKRPKSVFRWQEAPLSIRFKQVKILLESKVSLLNSTLHCVFTETILHSNVWLNALVLTLGMPRTSFKDMRPLQTPGSWYWQESFGNCRAWDTFIITAQQVTVGNSFLFNHYQFNYIFHQLQKSQEHKKYYQYIQLVFKQLLFSHPLL